jgi:hypothetical protein
MAWSIFVHSIRQVFGNLGGALQVSAVLMLAQMGILLTFGKVLLLDEASRNYMIQNGSFPWGQFLLALVLVTILSLWIAVGWHRYVLLEERPTLVPALKMDRILGYFGKSLLIGLILVLPLIVLVYVGGLIATALVKGGAGLIVVLFVVGLIVYLPLATIGTRLATVLPGVALEPEVPLFSGWEATRDATWTILGVVLLSLICFGGLEFILARILPDPTTLPATIANIILKWVATMVGVSVLTTLYGHYVENRPLLA